MAYLRGTERGDMNGKAAALVLALPERIA